jgi:hypothetical protein
VAGPVLVALGLLVPLGCGGSAAPEQLEAVPVTTVPGPYDYEYVIPAGTAYEISLGKDPKIMPDALDVKVGQTIRIENQDSKSHTIGTFYVLAGQTLTYRFSTAGVYEGICSTTPSKTFILTVRA